MCQGSPAVASDRDGSVALSLAEFVLVVNDMFCQEVGGGEDLLCCTCINSREPVTSLL